MCGIKSSDDGAAAKALKSGEAEEAEPEKPYDEMTWPERAADAAFKAAKEAKDKGLSEKAVEALANEAGEGVMARALQFGYQEPPPKKKFDASKPAEPQRQLSAVEQVRSAGLHPGVAAGGRGKGGKSNGKGFFGMTSPMMSGGMEGGYMG